MTTPAKRLRHATLGTSLAPDVHALLAELDRLMRANAELQSELELRVIENERLVMQVIHLEAIRDRLEREVAGA